jgi:hypothetical protein
MSSWKSVLLVLYYLASFFLGLFSFLRIYLWSKTSSFTEKSTVLSSKSESVDFPNFSNGLLVLSDAANSAGTYVWVVGGKAPGVLLGGTGGGSTSQPNFGTLVYNNTIRGYTWIKPDDFSLPFITMNFVKISL